MLYPKLEGGGDKTKDLLEDFKEFEKWMEKAATPKVNLTEAEKIPKLHRLILRAYHKLGLTNI
jgi:hypothetical protein